MTKFVINCIVVKLVKIHIFLNFKTRSHFYVVTHCINLLVNIFIQLEFFVFLNKKENKLSISINMVSNTFRDPLQSVKVFPSLIAK